MSEHKSVILNGQVLHGADQLGRWKVTQLDGWNDSPPVKSQDVARPNADGDFDLPINYGPRLVTIGGRVICSSQAQAQRARARITGLVQGLVRVQIMDEGLTTWADVKLNDAVTTKRTGTLVRFLYQLRAPEPRRYGDANPYSIPSGSAYTTLSHQGNAVGYPVIKVSGSFPGGYVLQSSAGAEYRVTTALNATPHTIDMATGLLVRNGSVVSGGVTRADLWRIQGASTATDLRLQPITTGSGTAAVTLLNTYI